MGRKKELVNHPRYGLVLQQVVDNQRTAKRAGWPGLPIAQIPLMCGPQYHAAIADGVLAQVERPARVDPTSVRAFVALTELGRQEWARLTELGQDAFDAQFVAAGGQRVGLASLSGAFI